MAKVTLKKIPVKVPAKPRKAVKNNQRIGIYPGTFDPVTIGHVDIIQRALAIVDKLIIAVAADIPKTPIFSLKKRAEIVESEMRHQNKLKTKFFGDLKRIQVTSFSGLLVDFAAQNKASIIIRGLRAISDFEYEFQMAAINSRLHPDIETVFLPASEETQFISSRFVKEIARLGGDVSHFVSPHVAKSLKSYFSAKK